jgi:glycosyltransferase involved in cell wall biosynthesis
LFIHCQTGSFAGFILKILHAIQSVDPTRGGPIESIRQLVAATTPEHSHHVVSIDAPFAPFLANCPLNVTALGPASLLGYSARLKPWLMENSAQFDCVVIHGLWRYISFGTWSALRSTMKPYCVVPHGMLDPWFRHTYPLKHLKKWLFWPWSEYRMLKDARAVIFTCEEERLRARKSFWLYRCHENVCAHALSGALGDDRVQRERFMKTYPQLAEKRVLLFLGRLHPIKGCDLLLTAFASAARHHSNLHLLMAGPCHDGWHEQLHNQARALGIEHRVTWTGMLEGDLKWGAFHSAEAFILPSHLESFGNAVVEALSCGLPILISNKVQIWREIAAEGAGIIEPDTLAGVENMLRRWLALSAVERVQVAQRARHCFAHRFEPRRSAEKFIQILRMAVDDSVVSRSIVSSGTSPIRDLGN